MTKKISEFPQGIELQNSSMDPNVWGSIPYGFSEFFLGPMLMARRKKTSSFFATKLKIYQLFYSDSHNIIPKNLALNHNAW